MRPLTLTIICCGFGLGAVPNTAGQALSAPTGGNLMLAKVMATIQRHASISARLRYQARICEHTQVGSGNYWQQGTEGTPLTYWEMKTQIAEETASYVQVFDGKHLWTDQRLPSGRQVRRLEVALLQSHMRAHPHEAHQLLLATAGQGGLAQMLAAHRVNFDFGEPRAAQLGGMPVHALIGHWRLSELKKIWPDCEKLATADLLEWPEQIPHHVLVLVGENMFPYLLEQRRASDSYLASTIAGQRPTHDPLVRYEIFEVQFATRIDRSRFSFNDDVVWKDETALVVERLQESRASIIAQPSSGTP
ncbi:MAG: hypothetical protein MK171_13000 [Pirellulales bacterium]|nr:hypothetical protein [Pirellulales bacterium]